MKWKNKTVVEMSGISLSPGIRELARAVNHNAETLKEAVQKIEKLNEEVEQLKGGGVDGN
jgi:TolA-binding protein